MQADIQWEEMRVCVDTTNEMVYIISPADVPFAIPFDKFATIVNMYRVVIDE